jgi:hypothetical protein
MGIETDIFKVPFPYLGAQWILTIHSAASANLDTGSAPANQLAEKPHHLDDVASIFFDDRAILHIHPKRPGGMRLIATPRLVAQRVAQPRAALKYFSSPVNS